MISLNVLLQSSIINYKNNIISDKNNKKFSPLNDP